MFLFYLTSVFFVILMLYLGLNLIIFTFGKINMAMTDDSEWLLSHIRHSFITSDDTGMCEMVIQDNDLLTLDEHREQLQKLAQMKDSDGNTFPSALSSNKSFSNVSTESNPKVVPRAPSPDILSGWDFGVRRRSNTAQKLERIRRERQNRVKVKTVHWKQMPERFVSDQLDVMFEKKNLTNRHHKHRNAQMDFADHTNSDTDSSYEDADENNMHSNLTNALKMQLTLDNGTNEPVQKHLVASFEGFDVDFNVNTDAKVDVSECRRRSSKPFVSALSKQLEESIELTHNPFKNYSKFDGRGLEGTTATQHINMFIYVYGEPPPQTPLTVVIQVGGAKIQDLIGLTCWRYFTEKRVPELKRDDILGYSLYIAEDDGEVDYGFPPLENIEPVSKFSFPTLALVEKHQVTDGKSEDGSFCESVFVKIIDYSGCFSLIQVDNLSITMGEILKKAIRRRKGQNYAGVYQLEYPDKPGVVVDENQTLDSTGVMEFCMIREHSSRSVQSVPKANDRTIEQESYQNIKPTTVSTKSKVKFIGL